MGWKFCQQVLFRFWCLLMAWANKDWELEGFRLSSDIPHSTAFLQLKSLHSYILKKVHSLHEPIVAVCMARTLISYTWRLYFMFPSTSSLSLYSCKMVDLLNSPLRFDHVLEWIKNNAVLLATKAQLNSFSTRTASWKYCTKNWPIAWKIWKLTWCMFWCQSRLGTVSKIQRNSF